MLGKIACFVYFNENWKELKKKFTAVKYEK